MAQLPSPNKLGENTTTLLQNIWTILGKAHNWLKNLSNRIWNWMRLHLPFIEALVQRHLANPSTLFVDLAIFVLGIYLAFGLTGGVLVYKSKSESKFTETLSVLYPLPAAKVDSSFIWSHEFLKRLRFLNTFNTQAPSSVTSRPPTDSQLRKQIMDGLIENQVLVLEAKKRNVTVSQEEVNAAYATQQKQTPDLEAKINQLYGMSVNDFKGVLAEKILKEKVTAAVITRVRVSHILTTSLDAATQAEKDLKAGKNFVDAAKEYSQDAQTKDSGGDLGYWTKGELASQINQAFEDKSFSLNVGDVSDPVQTKYGYHIIKVTEKTGNNYQSYADWFAGVRANYKISSYIQ